MPLWNQHRVFDIFEKRIMVSKIRCTSIGDGDLCWHVFFLWFRVFFLIGGELSFVGLLGVSSVSIELVCLWLKNVPALVLGVGVSWNERCILSSESSFGSSIASIVSAKKAPNDVWFPGDWNLLLVPGSLSDGVLNIISGSILSSSRISSGGSVHKLCSQHCELGLRSKFFFDKIDSSPAI